MNNKTWNTIIKIILYVILIIVIIGSIYYASISQKFDNTEKVDLWNDKLLETEVQDNGSDYQTKSDLINYQLEHWRNIILEIQCTGMQDIELLNYCKSEHTELLRIQNAVTWESVLNKWDIYISLFDCNIIEYEIWKEYCKEYKQTLSKSK